MPHEKPLPLTTASAYYKPVDVYCGLRDQILRLPAERCAVGFSGTVGALMETGFIGAVASLVMLSDGATSLYLSSGGGVIGAGHHKPVASAASAFLEAAARSVNAMQPATEFPLPLPKHTRFFLLSTEGTWTAEAVDQELGNNRQPLSPLFHLGHAVITAVRRHSRPPGAG